MGGRASFVRWADATAGLAVATFAGVALFDLAGEWLSLVFVDLAEVVVCAVSGGLCLAAARRSPRRSQRRGWVLLGASVLCWGAGQSVWSWYELVLRTDPFPSLADVGFLASVPLAIAALLSFSRAAANSRPRLSAALDGLIAGGSLLLISWSLVLGPSWRASDESLLALVITLAYPVCDIVSATMVLSVLARVGRGRRTPLALVGAGLFLLAAADTSFAWFILNDRIGEAGVSDVWWFAGFGVIGLAALRPSVAPVAADQAAAAGPPLRLLLPYVPLVAATGVGLSEALRPGRVDEVVVVTAFCLVVLVLTRQLLVLLENSKLARTLSVKLHELGAREEQMRHQAFHDPLTGLANRLLFADRVEHALGRRRRTLHDVAVLFLDLDDFKTVNDSLGHASGDELLVAVAARLGGCIRPGDTVARLGGDEFGVLLEEIRDSEEGQMVANRAIEALAAPFPVHSREVFVHASVGVAISGGLDETAEQLLGNADVALYAAKDGGKATSRLFEDSMRLAAMERLELTADLQRALGRNELILHYQPIVDLKTGEITAVEALARWEHPTRGVLSPAVFIGLAEETGLIAELGQSVFEQACTQAAHWREHRPNLSMSVNLSARQLQRVEVVSEVEGVLRQTGLDPSALVIEITESVLMRHGEAALDRLNALKALGVRLAIDDFGTGYSSLNYLRLVPVDVLKIDKAFADRVGEHAEDALLLRAIVDLGHTLGVEMVAEGIERADQVETLRALGCDRAQGFWFAPPAPPDVMEGRLLLAEGALPVSR